MKTFTLHMRSRIANHKEGINNLVLPGSLLFTQHSSMARYIVSNRLPRDTHRYDDPERRHPLSRDAERRHPTNRQPDWRPGHPIEEVTLLTQKPSGASINAFPVYYEKLRPDII